MGKLSIRNVKILNEGPVPVKVKCNFLKILETSKENERKKSHLENEITMKNNEKIIMMDNNRNGEKVDDTIFLNLSKALNIHPIESIILQSNEKFNLILKFKPQMRMKQFFEKIALKIDATILPLIIVKGSCVAAEFLLNRNYISFGSTVQGSTLNSKLMLLNTGDIGARFVFKKKIFLN